MRAIVLGAAAIGLAAIVVTPMVHSRASLARAARSVVGVLHGYDPATRTLTVTTDGGPASFVLRFRTTLHQGSRVVTPEQLRALEGSRIKIRYSESGGIRTADSIMLSEDSPN